MRDEEFSWRAYTARAAQLSPQGRYMTVGWLDNLKGRHGGDRRGGGEIVSDLRERLGFLGGD